MKALQKVFNYQNKQVRVVTRDDEPWFIANDVCSILEFSNPRETLKRLEDDEKGVISIDTLGGKQEMTIINESGLYELVLGSRKSEAKEFKRWIKREVLPSIRKTGAYSANENKVVPLSERQALIQSLKLSAGLAEEMEEVKSIAQTHSQKIIELEQKVDEQITVDSGEQRSLQKAIARKVYELEQNAEYRKELFRQLHREIRDRWGVPSYRDVRRNELNQVLRYVDAWMPRKVS